MYQSASDGEGGTSPRVPAPTSRKIDQKQLADIRHSLGPARFSCLLALAQSELAERPRAIRHFAQCEDFARLRSEAHNFKGAVASVGLAGVALAARAVELAAPGAELVLALIRLDGEVVHAQTALAHATGGEPMDVAAGG